MNDAPPSQGGIGRFLLGGLLVIDLVLLLAALSLWHITAEGPAQRGLSQSVAILIEVDTYLDTHLETLTQQAAEQQDAAPEERSVTLPDLPFEISFTPEELLTEYAERDALRTELLRRSAERVYDEGASVFLEERQDEISLFSLQGLLRRGMDTLRPTPHTVFLILTGIFALVAAIMMAGLVLSGRPHRRILTLGLGVFLAALPFLGAAIALRFALRQAADGVDDLLVEEFLTLAQELTWAPIRNGIIFAVGGGVFLVVGGGLALWGERP